ncbi:MAG: DUF1318 domain-containing protein [Pseudomonadota bacterium]
MIRRFSKVGQAMRALIAAMVLVLVMVPGAAEAQGKLDAYRASGVIAERFDGFVELRGGGAPRDAQALVSSVNAKRRSIYEKRAKQSDVPVGAVGRLFAEKIEKQAPKGTFIKQSDGRYLRK